MQSRNASSLAVMQHTEGKTQSPFFENKNKTKKTKKKTKNRK